MYMLFVAIELKRQLIRTKTWLLDFVKDKFPILYDRIEAKKSYELKILHVIIPKFMSRDVLDKSF